MRMDEPHPVADRKRGPHVLLMRKLKFLWRGELPLGEAFWTWAVTIGLAVNMSSVMLLLTLITLNAPEVFFLVCTALSLPYNILAIVGVWRAANHYSGPDLHADLARAASFMLLALLSLL